MQLQKPLSSAYQQLELIYKICIFKQTTWLLIQKSDFFSTNNFSTCYLQ